MCSYWIPKNVHSIQSIQAKHGDSSQQERLLYGVATPSPLFSSKRYHMPLLRQYASSLTQGVKRRAWHWSTMQKGESSQRQKSPIEGNRYATASCPVERYAALAAVATHGIVLRGMTTAIVLLDGYRHH